MIPRKRLEAILAAIANGAIPDIAPKNRIEYLLLAIAQMISDSGGGGGGDGVTPASIVTATGNMNTSQKTQTRSNIGAGTANDPAKVNKTAAQAEAGFSVAANTEYEVSGNPTALVITGNKPSGWWRIHFTTGATIAEENSLVVPDWCKVKISALTANTEYEFVCSDKGLLSHGTWGTS